MKLMNSLLQFESRLQGASCNNAAKAIVIYQHTLNMFKHIAIYATTDS